MNPVRYTQRRKQIKRLKIVCKSRLTTVVALSLDKRYKILKRELRRANFKKRLTKNLRDTGELFKADDGSWADWIASLASSIREALTDFIHDRWQVESDFWSSRDRILDPIDAEKVIAAYEAREGRQIADIGEDTKRDVLNAITDWYNTDEDLPTLINKLAQHFGEKRATIIANTETSFINSAVSRETYQQLGIDFFNVDLAAEHGEWPCDECRSQAAANPHKLGDQMSPFHPECECDTVPADDQGKELYFG